VSDCLFCSIVQGEIPAAVVMRDDTAVAFRDISPQAPTHLLVVPTRHIGGIAAAEAGDAEVLGHCLLLAREAAKAEGLTERGYRLVVNSGADAGESVPHLHIHVLGGRRLAWPPG
jgi:histidine triad (HIT) family protein